MTGTIVRKEKDPDRYSISQLGGWSWTQPIPNEHDSGVVRRFHALHRIPIGQLSAADLRFLVGQNECLLHLVPKALALLETDPWMETEFYPGDLLSALLRINHPAGYWSVDNPYLPGFAELAQKALAIAPTGVARKDLRLLEEISHLGGQHDF
ncbi:MAG: contact-dependent growth inhibition system immunity protein [Flavobacteriales bacterium]